MEPLVTTQHTILLQFKLLTRAFSQITLHSLLGCKLQSYILYLTYLDMFRRKRISVFSSNTHCYTHGPCFMHPSTYQLANLVIHLAYSSISCIIRTNCIFYRGWIHPTTIVTIESEWIHQIKCFFQYKTVHCFRTVTLKKAKSIKKLLQRVLRKLLDVPKYFKKFRI